MRFRAGIKNINTFTKLTASLSSLGNVTWLKLNENDIRFTVIPEKGTQVWAVVTIDRIFDTYTIQSAAEDNAINLEVPLAALHRALKSAQTAISASIRLTKKNNIPLLSLTITMSSFAHAPIPGVPSGTASTRNPDFSTNPSGAVDEDEFHDEDLDFAIDHPDRETVITQDIPIRVLTPAAMEGILEPHCREPDVHIVLPPLLQLKSISDRFTKLAISSSKAFFGSTTATATIGGVKATASKAPKLELAANMHGCLRLRLKTDAMNITSTWTGLTNPDLDPGMVIGGEDGVANHPSTRMRALGDAEGTSEEGWAEVRVDGKDWGKVLGVGRLGGRVIACFCHGNALILYVYLSNDQNDGDDSVLTYYVVSHAA